MIYQMQRCKLLLLGISRDNLFNKDLLLRNLLIYKLKKHRWNFAAGKKKDQNHLVYWTIPNNHSNFHSEIRRWSLYLNIELKNAEDHENNLVNKRPKIVLKFKKRKRKNTMWVKIKILTSLTIYNSVTRL